MSELRISKIDMLSRNWAINALIKLIKMGAPMRSKRQMWLNPPVLDLDYEVTGDINRYSDILSNELVYRWGSDE